MCFFGNKSTPVYQTSQTSSADTEKKDTAKAKARLLETQGLNKGAELNANQGQSVRRIFG